MAEPLRIATRRSPLALWQAEFVAAALRVARPELIVEIVPMSTEGDEILDRSLAAVGGKGLFTKELERAMLDGRAELAVHSLKDVPAALPEGMLLVAVFDPADPRDAFVSNDHATLDALPDGARVGSSSLRRQAQLQHRYPALRFEMLRGNVQSRLRRLDEGAYDAIILAVAGLERLGLGERVREAIDPAICVPAIGQGVLAVECRADDDRTRQALAALEHAPTRARITAERTVNARLQGSCHAPIAAYAVVHEGVLSLVARVGEPDGSRLLEARAEGRADAPEAVGLRVADDLLNQGAAAILAAAAAR
ncbi:MAG: hydroxymethylbilane synthase [Xanthomonadaceae bacterium]|nr:hydroxymethylbilane synthase [Xanthomonadaceae bacterium]